MSWEGDNRPVGQKSRRQYYRVMPEFPVGQAMSAAAKSVGIQLEFLYDERDRLLMLWADAPAKSIAAHLGQPDRERSILFGIGRTWRTF